MGWIVRQPTSSPSPSPSPMEYTTIGLGPSEIKGLIGSVFAFLGLALTPAPFLFYVCGMSFSIPQSFDLSPSLPLSVPFRVLLSIPADVSS
jgi:hypothetical protein